MQLMQKVKSEIGGMITYSFTLLALHCTVTAVLLFLSCYKLPSQ